MDVEAVFSSTHWSKKAKYKFIIHLYIIYLYSQNGLSDSTSLTNSLNQAKKGGVLHMHKDNFINLMEIIDFIVKE